jgi:hypothetical protein
MSVTPPTHTYTCPTITTVKSLGPGLDSVVTSATIYLTTASEVAYTETVTDTQWPVQTGTTEETYEQTQYTSPLSPLPEDLIEATDGTEVFREAIPRTKIGDVVSLTREVPTYDIPEPIVTTTDEERTKTFSSFAHFVVEFETEGLSSDSFVSYDSLTEEEVIGWARALVPDTFTEAETKNSQRVSLEADMFLNPDKYAKDSPVPPWRIAQGTEALPPQGE